MNALFDLYEAHAVPVTHPNIARAWNVIGGAEPYHVELNIRGEWSCSCKAFQFQGRKERPAGCKHTRFVAELDQETATV